jgi:hypothetical protein
MTARWRKLAEVASRSIGRPRLPINVSEDIPSPSLTVDELLVVLTVIEIDRKRKWPLGDAT